MHYFTETQLPARTAKAFVMADQLDELCHGIIERGGTCSVSEPVAGGFVLTVTWAAASHVSMAEGHVSMTEGPAAQEGRRGSGDYSGRWV